MKNLDLNAMGIVEMDAGEMKEVDGGFPIVALIIGIILVGAAAAELVYDVANGRQYDMTDGKNLILP